MSWPSYLAGGKAEALEAVLRVGFVLLSGVPAEPGRVLEVGPRGPVQQPVDAAAAAAVRRGHRVLRRLQAVGWTVGPARRQLTLRLAQGDCLIFDNTRVLHARTAFGMSPGSPGRHLQGCYADLDGLASTLAVADT